jgi:predicted DNA-binding WGR domain protein
MTRDEELAALRTKLAARKNRPGYAENVKAIEARIAELEAQE